MFETTPLQELDVETLFKKKTLESIVKIEKMLEAEIEHKRRDLRSMVGDRYKDILAASDAIKSMENISQKIVENIDHITSTSQTLVNNPVVLNQEDQSEVVKNKSEERSLIVQLRLAFFINNQIWTALEEENNLEAAQCCVFAQHIHTGLDLTRSDLLSRVPLLNLLKGNLAHLKTTIFQQISLKLECVELSPEEAIYNLNAQLLLENTTEVELLKTFIKHRETALDTVMKTQFSNVRLLISALTKCLITTILLFHQCFLGGNDQLGKVWSGGDINSMDHSSFNFPVTPLAKYIPDVIKQFRPNITHHLKSDKASLKNLIGAWLVSSKEAMVAGLNRLLHLVTSVKGLQMIRDEYFKIELPSDWEKLCFELNFPEKFSLWKYFFEDLLADRAKNLITEILSKNLNATKKALLSTSEKLSNSELDMRNYVWTESHLDFDKEDGNHKGLAMKSMGFSKTIVNLCEKLDQQYANLLSDVTPYLYEPTEQKHLENSEIEDHLISSCHSSAISLVDFVSNITEENKSSIVKSVFYARFLQAVCDLCPNMKRCSELNGHTNWRNICDNYVKHSHIFWKRWIESCVEKTTTSSKLLCDIGSKNIIKNLYRWDNIEIEEQADTKVVKSQIKIPLKPSVPLIKLLLKLNNDLCQILPYTLPNVIHLEYLERNGEVILRIYKSFVCEQSTNQVQALQFLFDVRFLMALCIPRENANLVALSQGICDELRSKIDPFDLDVFYAHLQSNVKKAIAQSQIIYGCLLPNTAQLSDSDISAKPKSQEKLPSILAISTPSTTAWFPVLPIRGPGVKNLMSKS